MHIRREISKDDEILLFVRLNTIVLHQQESLEHDFSLDKFLLFIAFIDGFVGGLKLEL